MKRLCPLVIVAVLILTGPAGVLAQREQLPPWRDPMPVALPTAEIIVGDVPVTVEFALSSFDQALGLGYRNGLAPGRGDALRLPGTGRIELLDEGHAFLPRHHLDREWRNRWRRGKCLP